MKLLTYLLLLTTLFSHAVEKIRISSDAHSPQLGRVLNISEEFNIPADLSLEEAEALLSGNRAEDITPGVGVILTDPDPTNELYDDTALDGRVTALESEPKYFFPIIFEENGGLINNSRQWSIGNGSAGNVDVLLPIGCEIPHLTFSAETAGTRVSIEVMKNGAVTQSVMFEGNHKSVTLGTPILFSDGDRIGLRTDVETGNYTDARVGAWFISN